MATGRRSILIDARVNGLAGAHGIARSVMKLTGHMRAADDGLALRVLVNTCRPQIFPLSELPAHAEVIDTDITLGAVHRCRELARLIRAVGAAALYSPYPVLTPLISPCPLVVTIHDCTIESDLAFAGGWPRQAGLKLATRIVLRRAVATTAPSQVSLAQIRHHYPAAPQPTLVPNGVDCSPYAAVTADNVAAARERYRLPGQFILTVGAHRPHKNHEVLVRALATLPGQVSLVIVGYFDPSFPDPLPGLISALGLESRVLLVPDVAEEWLPAVYQAASVFAFPSLAEGYGLPVLEAMASGVPVVASDIPALAEVAGPAAVLVPPREVSAWSGALAAVLADPLLSARLSAAGRAAAAGVSWERGASALRGLLSAAATGTLSRAASRAAPADDGALPGAPVAAR
jgi:glycosyltransferase involved in cell wall biosynthesis